MYKVNLCGCGQEALYQFKNGEFWKQKLEIHNKEVLACVQNLLNCEK